MHEVGGIVAFIVDDCEDLRLNTNRVDKILCIGTHSFCHGVVPTAEHTIVEWALKLMRSVAGANGRVWPMNFVGLADMHVNAVLPIIGRCELWIVCIVMLARIAVPHLPSKTTASTICVGISWMACKVRTLASLIILTRRAVFGAKVPVHIDRAKSLLEVRFYEGRTTTSIQFTIIICRNIAASLLESYERVLHKALDVVKASAWCWLLAGARVH